MNTQDWTPEMLQTLDQYRDRVKGVHTLIVHPGVAHMDDLLTVALLTPLIPGLRILRLDPTEAEINDPQVIVADIGRVYDPERRCFDHHQDAELPASFVLVLQYLGLWEGFRDCFPWAEYMSKMDTRGPNATLMEYDIRPDAADIIQNPIVGFVLSSFADEDGPILSQAPLIPFFQHCSPLPAWSPRDSYFFYCLGVHIYYGMLAWKDAIDKAADTRALVVSTKTRFIWFLCAEWATTPIQDKALVRRGTAEGFAGIVSPATRHAGWRLYRLNDHPMLNFSKIENDPTVAFAHKNGFLAETHERISIPEVKELIQKALVED